MPTTDVISFESELASAVGKVRAQWLESQPLGKRCAGLWRRFAASIIDSIILIVVNWIFSSIIALILAGVQPIDIGLFFRLAGASYFLLGILYHIGFWVWRSATPGKTAMGIKIVQTDGSPIGIGRAILRYVGYIVSAIIIFIGYLMIAWDSKKQGLHDKIADTLVIKVS